MGTRSLTVCKSRNNEQDVFKHDVTIYRHWSGFPDGQGKDLYDILKNVGLVNGINFVNAKELAEAGKVMINGPGRLAVHIIVKMQEGGNEPSIQANNIDCGQEWEYHVETDYPCGIPDVGWSYADGIRVRVFKGPVTAFGMGGEECSNEVFYGSVEEFGEWVALSDDEREGSVE